MEKTIRLLFDFQKYERNEELQAVVDAVHARYAVRELSDDEVDLVTAAGTAKKVPNQKAPWEKDNELS